MLVDFLFCVVLLKHQLCVMIINENQEEINKHGIINIYDNIKNAFFVAESIENSWEDIRFMWKNHFKLLRFLISYTVSEIRLRFGQNMGILVDVDATLKTIRAFCCKFQSFLQNGFIKNEVRVYNCHYKDTNNYFNTPSQRWNSCMSWLL